MTDTIRRAWLTSSFDDDRVGAFAESLLLQEARDGVRVLSGLAALLLAVAAIGHVVAASSSVFAYTYGLLALLAGFIFVAAKWLTDRYSLYLFGVVLLVVDGVSFILLGHRAGGLSTDLLASIVLLFVAVPLVPWGLREALAALLAIYATFTLSTMGAAENFEAATLVNLQLLMVASGLVSAVLVARNTLVRKNDIEGRYALSRARDDLEALSYRDDLTAAWNRRYLEAHFHTLANRFYASDSRFHFSIIDINDFKRLNDTHGHEAGDEVLQRLALTFRKGLADDGWLFRLGGDEFAVLFRADDPNAYLTSLMHRFSEKTQPRVTLSAGLVTVRSDAPQPLTCCYREADRELYAAKALKRDAPEQNHLHNKTLTELVPFLPRKGGLTAPEDASERADAMPHLGLARVDPREVPHAPDDAAADPT